MSQPWCFVSCSPGYHSLLGMKVGWGKKEKKHSEVVLKNILVNKPTCQMVKKKELNEQRIFGWLF